MRVSLLLLLTLVLSAQTARYKHGDDPRWSETQFDDSEWLTVPAGNVPLPPFESNGMIWIRSQVPVPIGNTPLAIRLRREDADAVPDELWVNGVRVGSHGRFPPNPEVRTRYQTVVFDLPPGLAVPGQSALVAWRVWMPPAYAAGLAYSPLTSLQFEIGERDLMRTREKHAISNSLLQNSLNPFFYVVEAMLGVGLLALWFATRGSRVLLYFGSFVFWWALLELWIAGPVSGRTDWSMFLFWGGWCVLSLITNVFMNEFLFAALSLSGWPAITLHVIGVVWPLLYFIGATSATASPLLAIVSQSSHLLFSLWGAGIALTGARAWARGSVASRGLGVAFTLWGTYMVLSYEFSSIFLLTKQFAGRSLDFENIATVMLICVMCWMLLRQLWAEWLAKEELRAEFDAATAVQQRLVPAAADVPGFQIESAYHPARQVGGDFFRVLPAGGGAVLLVVGDVSGKGLGAAMTVAAIAGALDNEFSRRPGEVLEHLNRALLLRRGEGFVTCCAALLDPSGSITIANAGHLAPYAEGRELPVEADLPLGLTSGVSYTETHLVVAGLEAITFVSDGVVEAENAQRELFGFDRTRELSTKPAGEIAEAAKAWGQTDDITVVTLRRVQ